MAVNNTIENGNTGPKRRIGNLMAKTVQLTPSGDFDGKIAVELSNNGHDWFETQSDVTGIVRLRFSTVFARVVVGGSAGRVTTTWHGIPIVPSKKLENLLSET